MCNFSKASDTAIHKFILYKIADFFRVNKIIFFIKAIIKLVVVEYFT